LNWQQSRGLPSQFVNAIVLLVEYVGSKFLLQAKEKQTPTSIKLYFHHYLNIQAIIKGNYFGHYNFLSKLSATIHNYQND
jgi:hypothetical protein